MSKKKPTEGKRPTPRVNVGVPEDWHAVMRKLAGRSKQPVLWYLIDLVSREGKEAGMELPPLPWDETDSE